MDKIFRTAGLLAVAASSVSAAGVERSSQSTAILFETGNFAELSFGFAEPDVSGTLAGVLKSGDMAGGYGTFSFQIKKALNDRLDMAVILDQPIGADVDYPAAGSYPLRGSTAKLTSAAVTGLIRYKLPSNFSVFGGLRAQAVHGEVDLPLVAAYKLDTNTDFKLGYVIGAAWERPKSMSRIAVTYNSKITHSLDANESSVVTGPKTGSFETEIPQSVNVEFRTGISRKAQLLLFGAVRWQEWSNFNITPPVYVAVIGSPLVTYQSDRFTYSLGLGKRFNENWSGLVTIGYEPSTGDVSGNLGPTDGYRSVGIGAKFSGNSAVGAGVKVGWTF